MVRLSCIWTVGAVGRSWPAAAAAACRSQRAARSTREVFGDSCG